MNVHRNVYRMMRINLPAQIVSVLNPLKNGIMGEADFCKKPKCSFKNNAAGPASIAEEISSQIIKELFSEFCKPFLRKYFLEYLQ